MKSLTPADIAPPLARYAHGSVIPASHRIVLVSGQLGQASDGSIPEEAFAQAQICFGNIQAILREADMTPADICHIRAYVTDRAHMQGYMRARDMFLADLSENCLPASTLLIACGFTRAEFKVEIEVIAAAP